MFKIGIIAGDSKGNFMPKATTTAQETANSHPETMWQGNRRLPFFPYIKENMLFAPLVTMFEALRLTVDWNYRQAYLLIETKDYPGDCI